MTRKIAYVYREDGEFSLAADEYERMEKESSDDEVRREALLTAAELHEKAGNQVRMLAVYRRYVVYFPRPVEPNVETRDKIAEIMKKKNYRDGYLAELRQIVAIDAAAAGERTPRTRALASRPRWFWPSIPSCSLPKSTDRTIRDQPEQKKGVDEGRDPAVQPASRL